MSRLLITLAAAIAMLGAAGTADAGCHRWGGWGGGWSGCGYRGVSVGWGGGWGRSCGWGGGWGGSVCNVGFRNCGWGGGWNNGGWGGGWNNCGWNSVSYGFRPSYVSYYRPNYFQPYNGGWGGGYGGYNGSYFSGIGSPANPIQYDAGYGYPQVAARTAPVVYDDAQFGYDMHTSATPAPSMVVREFRRTTPVVYDDAGIGYDAHTSADPAVRIASTPRVPVVVPAAYRPQAAPVTTSPAVSRAREF